MNPNPQSHTLIAHNPETRADRAEAFFALYHHLGAGRSLDALHATLTRFGLRLSLSTLRRYSLDYGWQARLEKLEGEAASEEVRPVSAIARMNERQASIGRAMQAIGTGVVRQAYDRGEKFNPAVAATLIKVGIDVERLASGEVTSRAEIQVSVYSRMVEEVVTLFQAVNELPDSEERKRRFALGLDALVDRYLEGSERSDEAQTD